MCECETDGLKPKERHRKIKASKRKIRRRRERKRRRRMKGLGFPRRSLLQSNHGNDAGTGNDTTSTVQCNCPSHHPAFHKPPTAARLHHSLLCFSSLRADSLISPLLSFSLLLVLCFFFSSFSRLFYVRLLFCFLPFLPFVTVPGFVYLLSPQRSINPLRQMYCVNVTYLLQINKQDKNEQKQQLKKDF